LRRQWSLLPWPAPPPLEVVEAGLANADRFLKGSDRRCTQHGARHLQRAAAARAEA
jgi:hypothetical protein